MNELYEIEQVKMEFLQGIAEEYSTIFTERQLEMSVYMLNEFCNTCTNNNLALIRIPEQQYQQPQNPFENIPEIPINKPQNNTRQQVEQMNKELQQPRVEVDLSTTNIPKTFAERIRDMRSSPKKQPGNKVNPEE